MDRASHQFFPRASFSLDQDGEVGVGHLPDLLDDLLDVLAAAHEPAKRVTLAELVPERLELSPQRLMLERPPHHDENFFGFDRLGQEVVGAEAHRLDR